MRVLLIDSDRDSSDAICDALRDSGHEVHPVADGLGALAALADSPLPDLILLDVVTSTEIETYKRQNGDAQLASLPVVVLSATSLSQRTDLERHLAKLVILEKPFGVDALMEAVETASSRTDDAFRSPFPPKGLVAPSAITPIADFLGVSYEQAETLVKRISHQDQWEDGPGEGVALMRVSPGAQMGAEDGFLVWIADGATYPFHTHTGDEPKLLLRGGLLDTDGSECWAGELVTHKQGTSHHSVAIGGAGCLLAAMVMKPREHASLVPPAL